jgi:hypothetical protein
MPLNRDGTVNFNATLFGLVRTSLNIKRPEGSMVFTVCNIQKIMDPSLLPRSEHTTLLDITKQLINAKL